MLLLAFMWVVSLWHLIGALGSIELIKGGRKDGWQIAGLVFHVVIVLWGGLLLWLMR